MIYAVYLNGSASHQSHKPYFTRSLSDLTADSKEIVISSSDATGLGVDVCRVILDFGLNIVYADLMTDGVWAYLVLRVVATSTPVRWSILREKLELTCPGDSDTLNAMSHIPKKDSDPFLVRVCGHDRKGMLHRITQSFWAVDCSVFKAHVSTAEDGHAVDSFWILDNTGLLPSADRAVEISDHLGKLLGNNIEVSITPAPSATQVVPKNVSAAFGLGYTFFEGEKMRRLDCKDATSHLNLRSLVIKSHVATKHWSSSDSLITSRSGNSSAEDLFNVGFSSPNSLEGHNNDASSPTSRHTRMSSILMESPQKQVVDVDAGAPDFASRLQVSDVNNSRSKYSLKSRACVRELDLMEHIIVEADTETSSEYILLSIICANRKGILYDIFVQLKEIRVRVANCRTLTMPDNRVRVELMVQDAYGGDVCSADDSASILIERLKESIAKPVTIHLGHGKKAGQYRLLVVAVVDAGGRGRPRVTYDVTKLFSALSLSIVECEVFVEEGAVDEDESFEVHKYIFEPDKAEMILTRKEMLLLTDAIQACLKGGNNVCAQELGYECSQDQNRSETEYCTALTGNIGPGALST
jgi:glycine cleavage system regulatory protein